MLKLFMFGPSLLFRLSLLTSHGTIIHFLVVLIHILILSLILLMYIHCIMYTLSISGGECAVIVIVPEPDHSPKWEFTQIYPLRLLFNIPPIHTTTVQLVKW